MFRSFKESIEMWEKTISTVSKGNWFGGYVPLQWTLMEYISSSKQLHSEGHSGTLWPASSTIVNGDAIEKEIVVNNMMMDKSNIIWKHNSIIDYGW